MSRKPTLYSKHARARLRRRKITRQDVQALLARGTRQEHQPGVFEVRGYLGRYEAKVVYEENAKRRLVISIMWIEKRERRKPRGRA